MLVFGGRTTSAPTALRRNSLTLSLARVLLIVGLASGLPWRAQAVGHRTAGSDSQRKTIALISTTSHKDKVVRDLFQSALESVAGLNVIDNFDAAELIAELQVSHSTLGTELKLSVINRNGTVICRTNQTVRRGGSLVDAAESMVRPVRSALGGAAEPPPTVTVESPPPDGGEPPPPAPAAAPEPAAPTEPEMSPPPRSQPPPAEASEDDQAPPLDEYRYERRRLDFMAGVELGGGPWNADPSNIIHGAADATGFDFTQYAPAFTRTLDGRWSPGLNLHGGWKFLGIAAIEAAVHTSLWSSGGSVLAGVRASLYPLTELVPHRKFDFAVELGGGYAFVGSGLYDMSGSYFTVGLRGEYPLTSWLSLVAYYRLFTPFLSRFYVDYKNNITEPVSGFTAFWNTLGVGVNFRFTKYL